MHIKSMRCKIICIPSLPFFIRWVSRTIADSIGSCCLHSLFLYYRFRGEVIKSFYPFNYFHMILSRLFTTKKKRHTKKEKQTQVNSEAATNGWQKPQKFPLQPNKFFCCCCFCARSFSFHQQEMRNEQMWKKHTKKCNSNFGTRGKKIDFYVFLHFLWNCCLLFCHRCKWQCVRNTFGTLTFMIRRMEHAVEEWNGEMDIM